MIELKRISTTYDGKEDRMRLAGEAPSGEAQVLWLTQRLLVRMLPHLLGWLERQSPVKAGSAAGAGGGPGAAHAEAVHSFAQQAARASLTRQAPVNATAPSRSWLVHSVEIAPVPDGLRFVFVGADGAQDERAGFVLQARPLRQWLNILYDKFRKAGWPLDVWPGWMAESAPARPGQTVLLH